jgi:hypothetical protein
MCLKEKRLRFLLAFLDLVAPLRRLVAAVIAARGGSEFRGGAPAFAGSDSVEDEGNCPAPNRIGGNI